MVKNASTGDNICGKVVGMVSGIGRAREPLGERGNDSSDLEVSIKPKNKA